MKAKAAIAKSFLPVHEAWELLSFCMAQAKCAKKNIASFSTVSHLRLHNPAISPAVFAYFKKLVFQRKKGVPLSYIMGYTSFYGRDILVNASVLIPRSETEELVELAISEITRHSYRTVWDVGTGSGCIAVTLASLLPVTVYASDISAAALIVAKKNARLHGVTVQYIKADLLKSWPLTQPLPDVLVANLPYVAVGDVALDEDVRHTEPSSALYAEENGCGLFRRLFCDIAKRPSSLRPKLVLLEMAYTHAARLRALAYCLLPFYSTAVHQDAQGHDRFFVLRLR